MQGLHWQNKNDWKCNNFMSESFSHLPRTKNLESYFIMPANFRYTELSWIIKTKMKMNNYLSVNKWTNTNGKGMEGLAFGFCSSLITSAWTSASTEKKKLMQYSIRSSYNLPVILYVFLSYFILFMYIFLLFSCFL